jgi:ketosteroid isomerase-like protein
MIESRAVSEWLNGYAGAWESADPRAAAELFTVDAGYRSHIMSSAHIGTDGIAEYWRHATSSQSDVEVHLGEPLVDGDRVVVEWWTQMTDEGAGETLPGVLLLRFSGELCSSLREYWHVGDTRVGPYPGWGEMTDGDQNSTRASVRRWARGYEAAWRSLDPEAAAALYADQVVYRSHPLHAPEVGRAGVLGYSRRAFGSEADPDPAFGEPVVSGSCAAVEYWTSLVEEGREATLAGCCVLTFSHDGLVEESREYWFLEDGRREPPPEWGWR